MQVTIRINNLITSTLIQANENNSFIFINNEKINYNATIFLNKLLPIISSWDRPKKQLMIKDAENYEITIISENNKKILRGKSYQHSTYKDFKRLISEVMA